MRVFRLVRATGQTGCAHHVLLRAGRPSYPNADQGAENAADAFPGFVLDALTGWWERWMLPAQCRGAAHELAVIADPVEVVGPDLHDDIGLRSFDVWTADRDDGFGAVLAAVPDAAAFRTVVEEEAEGEVSGAPVRLRVLLLTESSGDGDLRDA
ncbi:hypothetical protein SAMN04489726_3140 [Allokutzneria albata]|uniref:Uncharacterized protein n=2 Tax=Allokutzneria albata TaxID=211114 RepID=A0A1G9VNS2_ALLAB|nr:hypothetical protein SAMN04489726_3140 [Allokutzneria albata]